MPPAPVVVVGLGQLGALFATGWLRAGRPVVPIPRDTSMQTVARDVPAPALVLIAVGEAALHGVLGDLPAVWRSRVALLQNELLPHDWLAHELGPTVAAVWFEKKATSPVKELLPTELFGPGAPLLAEALERVGVRTRALPDHGALLHALVAKNLYILTTNLAGLEVGGDVRTLFDAHRPLADRVARDVLDVQAALAGTPLPREELMRRLRDAIDADPTHACAGRTAGARLARTLAHADRLGLAVPELRRLAAAEGAGS